MSESCCRPPDGVRLYIGEGALRGPGRLVDSFPKKTDEKGQRSPAVFRTWDYAFYVADNQHGAFQQLVETRGGIPVRIAERQKHWSGWGRWEDATSPKREAT